jgi:hypothetical protein
MYAISLIELTACFSTLGNAPMTEDLLFANAREQDNNITREFIDREDSANDSNLQIR